MKLIECGSGKRAARRGRTGARGKATTVRAIAVVAGVRARSPSEHEKVRRIVNRDGVKHNGINEREDSGVGSDSESERQNCDGSEAGIFAEHTEAVAQVLEQSFDHRKAPSLAIDFLGLFHATQL